MKRILVISVVVVVAVIAINPVFADEGNVKEKPWEKFSLTLGGFSTSIDSNVRVSSEEVGVGIVIDVEDTLGMESTTSVFRTEALYRAGESKRHKIELSYLAVNRRSTKTLDEEIKIGDKVYPVSTRVDSHLNIDIIRTGYSYSLLFDDRMDLGIGLGLFIMPISVGVEADKEGEEAVSITAPLPTINISGNFALTDKLFLKQRIDLFWLEIDNFKGVLTDLIIAIEYNLFKHVGVGFGFDSFRLNLTAKGEDYPEIDFRGDLEFSYFGAMLYGKVYY